MADKTPTPRWVKIFAGVAAVLFVIIVILHLTGLAPHHHTLPAGLFGSSAS